MKGTDMDKVRDALAELEQAEAHYRLTYQIAPSVGHLDVGRAWDRMRKAGDAAREALSAQPAETVSWEGTECWEALAWQLCADENGEDACNELVWEGGAIPEPWGDRWLKYEGEAKRMIALVQRHAPQPAPSVPAAWVACAERMPASGVTVLACYTNSAGNVRRIRAEWVAAKTIESDADSEISEYDEATDCYYDPEGWYEKIDNWGDYSSVAVVEGEITHWMPLPAAPHPAAKGGAE